MSSCTTSFTPRWPNFDPSRLVSLLYNAVQFTVDGSAVEGEASASRLRMHEVFESYRIIDYSAFGFYCLLNKL